MNQEEELLREIYKQGLRDATLAAAAHARNPPGFLGKDSPIRKSMAEYASSLERGDHLSYAPISLMEPSEKLGSPFAKAAAAIADAAVPRLDDLAQDLAQLRRIAGEGRAGPATEVEAQSDPSKPQHSVAELLFVELLNDIGLREADSKTADAKRLVDLLQAVARQVARIYSCMDYNTGTPAEDRERWLLRRIRGRGIEIAEHPHA